VESNVVEVLIHAVRKKFDNEIIRNVRGIGWMVTKHTP
jgi:DNA-binding response OmpR family regulator